MRTRAPASCSATRCWTACEAISPRIAARLRSSEWLSGRLVAACGFPRAMAAGLRKSGELTAAFELLREAGRPRAAAAAAGRDRQDASGAPRPLVRAANWAILRRDATGETAAKIDQAVAARLQRPRRRTRSIGLAAILRHASATNLPPPRRAGTDTAAQRRADGGWRRSWRRARSPAKADVAAQRPRRPRRNATPIGRSEGSRSRRRKVNEHRPQQLRPHDVESARQPRPYLPRSVAAVRLQPPSDFRVRCVWGTRSGRLRWPNGQQQYYSFNPSWNHGRAIGHLLLALLGLEDHCDRHAGRRAQRQSAGVVDART